MEAGGHQWDDAVKIGFLNEALRWELKDRMVSVNAERRFEPYCRQLQEISNKLDEVRKFKFPTYFDTIPGVIACPEAYA